MAKLLTTIQDVIDELNKVEDKSQPFVIHVNDNGWESEYATDLYDITVKSHKVCDNEHSRIEIYR